MQIKKQMYNLEEFKKMKIKDLSNGLISGMKSCNGGHLKSFE